MIGKPGRIVGLPIPTSEIVFGRLCPISADADFLRRRSRLCFTAPLTLLIMATARAQRRCTVRNCPLAQDGPHLAHYVSAKSAVPLGALTCSPHPRLSAGTLTLSTPSSCCFVVNFNRRPASRARKRRDPPSYRSCRPGWSGTLLLPPLPADHAAAFWLRTPFLAVQSHLGTTPSGRSK